MPAGNLNEIALTILGTIRQPGGAREFACLRQHGFRNIHTQRPLCAVAQQLLVQITHATADLQQPRVGDTGLYHTLDQMTLRRLESATRVASPVTACEMAEELSNPAAGCTTTTHT